VGGGRCLSVGGGFSNNLKAVDDAVFLGFVISFKKYLPAGDSPPLSK